MKVIELASLPFLRFVANFIQPFLNYTIQGKEIINNLSANKIIVTDKINIIELLILIHIFEISPVFLANELIIQRYKFLFKGISKKPEPNDTLIITLESFQGQYFLNLNQYAYPAYVAKKLKATIISVSIVNYAQFENPIGKINYLFGRVFLPRSIEVRKPEHLSPNNQLDKHQFRVSNALFIYNIASNLLYRSKNKYQTIFEALKASAVQHGMGHHILEDPTSGVLNYRKTLISIRVLANKIHNLKIKGKSIGIMLPNSCGAAITFLSVMSSGKISAMINFTSGYYNIFNSCKAAGINEIITSRLFIETANLEPLIESISNSITIIYLEDIKADITILDKFIGYLFMRYPIIDINPNNCATILFTSGSEGKPKGVALSHNNILSNAAQISAQIHFDHNDIVMNILPVFHCFGLNMGLILPLISGVKVYLYPSPLHYKTIPEIIHKSNATIFFGTDTFLSSYAKVSKFEQYKSIRYILAGAEKLRSNTKHVWKENFNIDILEGYGVTETSPVISLNTPAFNKCESTGIILPHIEFFLKKVDGVNQGGQLYVKGPNVMMGYLHSDEPEVITPLEDGWHDTGDIVEIDENKFLSIRGRVKRFAKIGGEMISLAIIDGFASDIWPEATSVAAAKFDPKKGQKIVLITNCLEAKLEDLRSLIKSAGLTEIYVPAQLIIIEQIPLLGSGKVDYSKIQELIMEK